MASDTLVKISINDLKPGMYVEKIAEQKGNLQVASRGKVTKRAIVASLKKRGVTAVIVDTSKQFIPEDAPPPEPIEQAVHDIEIPTPESKPEPVRKKVTFDDEVAIANKLHKKGKSIQKRMLSNVAKGLPTDIAVPEEFSKNLVGSIDRNPNALLCLTKIREKDDYLLEHSLNVAILLANFAQYIGLKEEIVQELALSGFLHDIGKIKIPDKILHKPGRLTDQEMNVMRDHVVFGIEALREMDIPERMIRTVGEHHERLDGFGYPEGKRDDEISFYGRMISIVDVYDALTADRVYKAGMPSQKALQILLKDTPDKYDRELVQKFIKCIGIYPVGSLVKLNDETIAMVVKHNEDSPLKPVVKVFYSLKGNHYVAPQDINLAAKTAKVSVEKAVLASDYKIDFNAFFEEKIAI
ncbi:HD-GYP domain-containing protein [Alteromonas oceanisediminis]|uniref:HD-GYP domain-containing protein n=1 Tax=Alteromonas oceanisediminis TaxID=2836180 RepID=UPI001BDAB855|nr:HD-GYP domain-containing protein [Alteromonas oceanisediminis]MBT0587845.1 HD-GYP domain-containing protein [Alteromonas oceanisediminis]